MAEITKSEIQKPFVTGTCDHCGRSCKATNLQKGVVMKCRDCGGEIRFSGSQSLGVKLNKPKFTGTPSFNYTPLSIPKDNNERYERFKKTLELSKFLEKSILIDSINKLWYVGKDKGKQKITPRVYAFDEITDFQIVEIVVEEAKTVTKKSGGITRAIVGGVLLGPIGAVVGAVTAKTEAKNLNSLVVQTLNVSVETPWGKYVESFTGLPPDGFLEFLRNNCKKKSLPKTSTEGTRDNAAVGNESSADEIQKFHELFIKGIITQDQFEHKKKQLLGI